MRQETYSPFEVAVLAGWSRHTERDWNEENEYGNDDSVGNSINSPRDLAWKLLRKEVEEEAKDEDGKVESRVVMMDVGNSAHHDEWNVMERPSDQWVESVVVPLINIIVGEILATSLPSKEIEDKSETKHSQCGSGSPVDDWVTQQEVLDNLIIPRAHSQTNVQNWPLPPEGGEVVLLVWVWYEGVVGGHHGNVQVKEIPQEWRLERRDIGLWN